MAWQFCMKSSFKRSLFERGAVSIQISLVWLTWAILWISLFMSILLLPFLPCLVCVHIELCLLSCWEREVASVAWVACRQIGCLVSYFVVAIRRAWPESSICLSLRSLDIPRLHKIASFVLFSCLEAKVSPTDGKLARTYRVRVQFWCLTRVVLRGRPWH